MTLASKIFNGKTLTVALLAAALAGGAYYRHTHPAAKAAVFRTAPVDRGDIVQTVSANGTLNPVTLVSVGTQVSGTVRKLMADFNQQVKKGQVLLQLDDAIYASQVQQSEANVRNVLTSLDLAKANEARMQSLFAQEYVSRLELDQAVQARRSAEAQRDQALAQLAHDRANLNYTIIRSPVSGVVVARQVDVGQTVAASYQTPELFKIAQDLTKLQIHSNFAEADIGQIRVGQKAQFSVDAYPTRKFDAVVEQIRLNPTVQQNVVTYDVVLDVDNPELILLPGMTAYVNISVAEKNDALRIPSAALRYKPTQESTQKSDQPRGRKSDSPVRKVYVLRDEQAVPVTIVPGINDNRFTEVISGGIKEGDAVIVGDAQPEHGNSNGGNNNAGGSGVRMRLF